MRLIETVRTAVPGDRRVVAGAGAESTRRSVALAHAAAAAGADAVLVIAPHYYSGAMTPDRLVRHFHDVAEASPIPVIAYNVPRNTHLDIDAATVARLAEHPNLVGLKDSSGNVAKLADVVRRCRGRLRGPGGLRRRPAAGAHGRAPSVASSPWPWSRRGSAWRWSPFRRGARWPARPKSSAGWSRSTRR